MESQNLIGQFRVPKPSLSKWGQVHNPSCGNEFYLHENIILISKAEHLTSFWYRGSGTRKWPISWREPASGISSTSFSLISQPAPFRGVHLFASDLMSFSLGTCGRRFRRAFPSNRRFFNEIVAYQELFCVVTLLSELEWPRQRRRKRKHIKSNRFPIKVDSQGLPFVSIGVKISTYLKNEDVFTQNVFLVHQQTILEVNEIFVQFHCLSSYRNDLCWNRFPVPKRRLTQNGQLYSKISKRFQVIKGMRTTVYRHLSVIGLRVVLLLPIRDPFLVFLRLFFKSHMILFFLDASLLCESATSCITVKQSLKAYILMLMGS